MIKQIEDKDVIISIVDEFDAELNPSISSLVGDLTEYANKLYSNAIVIIVDDEQNKKIGFASFYCNDNQNYNAFLSQIAVKKDFKACGYGTMLIKACEKISKKNGMKRLRLEVYKKNDSAIKFYEKNGYKYEKECSNDSFFMVKEFGDEVNE